MIERDIALSKIDERTKALEDGSSIWEHNAGKLKNKFWTKNIKYVIAGAIVGVILLLILLYFTFSDDQNHYPQKPYQPGQKQLPPEVNPESDGQEGSNVGGTSD